MGRQFLLACSSPWNWGCFPENSMKPLPGPAMVCHCLDVQWSCSYKAEGNLCTTPLSWEKERDSAKEWRERVTLVRLRTEALPDLSISHTLGFHPGLKQPNTGGYVWKWGLSLPWVTAYKRRVREKNRTNMECFELRGILKLIQLPLWQGLEQDKL